MVNYIKLLSKREARFGQKLHSWKVHSILIDIRPFIIKIEKRKRRKFHVVGKPCSAQAWSELHPG